jgi:outer membrane immunogenic protein
MKHLVLCVVACAGVSGVASAADLPSRNPPAPLPALAPAFTWTGFYVGGHVGALIQDGRLSLGSGVGGETADVAINPGLNAADVKGGFLFGYNYQWGAAVLGLEGDMGFGGETRSSASSAKPNVPVTVWSAANGFTQKTNGHIRGRVGFAWGPALFYAAGGFAATSAVMDVTGYCPPAIYPAPGASHSLQGYSVGGGVEYAVTSNFLLRAEYLYDDYGQQTYNVGRPDWWQSRSVSLQTHTVRSALSYKF